MERSRRDLLPRGGSEWAKKEVAQGKRKERYSRPRAQSIWRQREGNKSGLPRKCKWLGKVGGKDTIFKQSQPP